MLQTDANLSVIAESQQHDLRTAVYSAYGERHSDKPMFSLKAFNGEMRENSGWYLLGRGYRAYNPGTKRFHSPDSLSPFGSGGVNPYTYCLGNPIALRDPTGHSSIGYSGRPRRPDEGAVPGLSAGGGSGWMNWLWVAIGAVATAAAVVATIVTAGGAAPLVGAAFAWTVAKATALGIGAALGLGSTVSNAIYAANGDETAADVGMYLGIAALPTVVVSGFASAAASAAQKLSPQLLSNFDKIVAGVKDLSSGTLIGFGDTSVSGGRVAVAVSAGAAISLANSQADEAGSIGANAGRNIPKPPPMPANTPNTVVSGPTQSDLFKAQIKAAAEKITITEDVNGVETVTGVKSATTHANDSIQATSSFNLKENIKYTLKNRWDPVRT
ncbi:RHS repeat-associated core domain-containing protein [Pseudomonas azerbaijanoccidentalis]